MSEFICGHLEQSVNIRPYYLSNILIHRHLTKTIHKYFSINVSFYLTDNLEQIVCASIDDLSYNVFQPYFVDKVNVLNN